MAPFLSEDYLASPWPMDDFRAMLVPSLSNPDDFILPVLVGGVMVPPELLSPAVGMLRMEDHTPQELARAFEQRIKGSAGPVPAERQRLRAPLTTPAGFSKYAELETSFRYLTQRFKTAAPTMSEAGFICTAHNSDAELRVRVERHGTTLYGIDIQLGGMGRDDVLNFVVGQRRAQGRNSSNGTASPVFDRAAGAPKLDMHDFSVLGATPSVRSLTKEELFEALWDRLVEEVQQRADGR